MWRQYRTLYLLAAVLGLLLSACDRADRGSLGAETDDPQYRRGQQLLKEGRNQEALGAFLKAVDRRGDDAPESHLEAGLLYQQYFRDPISAIYHFRKYLEAQPNSRQADLVRQRIDAAMRDFARSLPAQPLESQTARLELMEKIDALQKENQQLKEQITAMNPGGGGAAIGRAPAGAATPPATMRLVPLGASPAAVAARPPAPVRGPAATATPPKAAAGRTHVVAQGETLYKIAQRYYGSGARWPEILEANRNLLKNENSVRPGMELRIP